MSVIVVRLTAMVRLLLQKAAPDLQHWAGPLTWRCSCVLSFKYLTAWYLLRYLHLKSAIKSIFSSFFIGFHLHCSAWGFSALNNVISFLQQRPLICDGTLQLTVVYCCYINSAIWILFIIFKYYVISFLPRPLVSDRTPELTVFELSGHKICNMWLT